NPAARLADASQRLDVLDIHHPRGRVNVLLHEADQVRPAGENIHLSPLRAQRPHCLRNRGGIGIREVLHYAFLLSIAASTRSGLSGIRGTRTPMAFATALPIAVNGLTAGGSPKPTTPRLSCSAVMSRCTITSPISPIPASL